MATSKHLNPDNAKANKKGPKAVSANNRRAHGMYEVSRPLVTYKKAVPPYAGSKVGAKGGR